MKHSKKTTKTEAANFKLVSVEKDEKNINSDQATIKTMDQYRAKFALDEINQLKREKSQGVQVEFRRYVNSFSAMIRMNGLGQAIAFYTMKGDTYLILVKHIEQWLCHSEHGKVFNNPSSEKLLDAITTSDMKTYMAAQNEALALLEWTKKFALAFFDKE